jgi:hypothetical protein
LEDKVRLAVCCKQPELLEHGIILLQDNATVIAIMICKIWCNNGAERCWQILPALQISPYIRTSYDYWLFAHVKEHLRGKGFESKDDVNTAVTASLHHLSKDECRATI